MCALLVLLTVVRWQVEFPTSCRIRHTKTRVVVEVRETPKLGRMSLATQHVVVPLPSSELLLNKHDGADAAMQRCPIGPGKFNSVD